MRLCHNWIFSVHGLNETIQLIMFEMLKFPFRIKINRAVFHFSCLPFAILFIFAISIHISTIVAKPARTQLSLNVNFHDTYNFIIRWIFKLFTNSHNSLNKHSLIRNFLRERVSLSLLIRNFVRWRHLSCKIQARQRGKRDETNSQGQVLLRELKFFLFKFKVNLVFTQKCILPYVVMCLGWECNVLLIFNVEHIKV